MSFPLVITPLKTMFSKELEFPQKSHIARKKKGWNLVPIRELASWKKILHSSDSDRKKHTLLGLLLCTPCLVFKPNSHVKIPKMDWRKGISLDLCSSQYGQTKPISLFCFSLLFVCLIGSLRIGSQAWRIKVSRVQTLILTVPVIQQWLLSITIKYGQEKYFMFLSSSSTKPRGDHRRGARRGWRLTWLRSIFWALICLWDSSFSLRKVCYFSPTHHIQPFFHQSFDWRRENIALWNGLI